MGKKGKGKENLDRNMAQDDSAGPSLFKYSKAKNRLDAFKEDSLVFAPIKPGTFQIAKIIACRVIETPPEIGAVGDGQDLEYYIHFEGYNRRIDQWMPHKELLLVRKSQ